MCVGRGRVEKQNWDGSCIGWREQSRTTAWSFGKYHLVFSFICSSTKTREWFCQIPETMPKRRLLMEFTLRTSQCSGPTPQVNYFGRINDSKVLIPLFQKFVLQAFAKVLYNHWKSFVLIPWREHHPALHCRCVVPVNISAQGHLLWHWFGSPGLFLFFWCINTHFVSCMVFSCFLSSESHGLYAIVFF